MKTTLRAIPNPFHHLDHRGVPASAYPFDPGHSPDRRWVGATVDRSEGADGLPRTRKMDTDGDLTAILPRGRLKGRTVYVDRAPRKRVQFAFDVETPVDLPPGSSHYLLGFRERSLIPADAATAKAVGLSFVDPKAVLRNAAAHAVTVWTREHDGEAPDFDLWPANLRDLAGRAPKTAKTVEQPKYAAKTVDLGAAKKVVAEIAALAAEGEPLVGEAETVKDGGVS